MLQPGDVLDLTPLGGKFIIRKTGRESDGRSFDMEWVLTPHADGNPVHTHPNAIETYEVLEGALDIFIDGTWKRLTPGEKAVAEMGVPHTFRSATSETTRVYNTHKPALNYAEYFEKMAELVSLGIVDSPKISFKALLNLSILATSYPDEIQTVKPPALVVKMLASLGRILGYGKVFAPQVGIQI